MKKILPLFIIILAFPLFASTQVELKRDIYLTHYTGEAFLGVKININKKNTYCELRFQSVEDAREVILPQGTILRVSGVNQNECHVELGANNRCSLSLNARNDDLMLEMQLICDQLSFFATRFDNNKLNKTMKDFLEFHN